VGGGGAEEVRADHGHAFQCVGHRARLLEDLLLHEVAVRAQLDARPRGLDVHDAALHALAVRVGDDAGLAPQVGDVALLEVRHATGDRQQRRGVGGEEVVVLAVAHDQRAALAGADQTSRLAGGDDGDGVGAVELGDRRLDGAP
jgi:hypothetical protein